MSKPGPPPSREPRVRLPDKIDKHPGGGNVDSKLRLLIERVMLWHVFDAASAPGCCRDYLQMQKNVTEPFRVQPMAEEGPGSKKQI
jgi:hypothetical protein